MASPRVLVLSVAIAATLAAGLGFGAAQLVESPEEAAARVAPPAAEPITVDVERQELSSQIVTRADVGFDDPVPVTIAAGKDPSVVTGRVPESGSEITPGAILLEVTGRPVIVLPGLLSTYRTLTPGAVGPDVLQLQQALIDLQRLSGTPSGTYDAATAAAVRTLYADLGYPAPESEKMEDVTTAEEGVTSAQKEVDSAKTQLNEADQGPKSSEEIGAQNAVNQAAAALETARTTGTPPDERAVTGAQDRLTRAETALQTVQEELTAAQQSLAEVTGTDQQPYWEAEVARVSQLVQSATGEKDAAAAALAKAQQNGPPSQTAINEAQGTLNLARAQLTELRAGPDTSAQQTAVTEAESRLADAQKALTEAQAAADTPLPASEVVYLTDFPRRVGEVKAKVGALLDGPALTVSGATVRATATLSAQEAELLQKGGTATVTLPGLDPIQAVLAAPERSADGVWTTELDLGELSPEQAVSIAGANVRVVVPVGATSGEVLVVPVAALFSDSTGNPRVEVRNSDGTTRFQLVEVGLTADGLAEIKPVDDKGAALVESETTLTEKSEVVVGR